MRLASACASASACACRPCYALLAAALDNEDIFVSDRGVCQQLERERRSRPVSHTDRDRRLSILELAQCRRARFHAQAVAHAVDQLRVRRPAEDYGAAHRGRAK
jgi:hypothetical protein